MLQKKLTSRSQSFDKYDYKPGASLRGREFISTSISPGKTGLKANYSKNDSLGKYCKSSSECAIFDASVCSVEAKCFILRISRISVGSEVTLSLL